MVSIVTPMKLARGLTITALLAVVLWPVTPAGELQVGDGVVVKFGPNGELIIRDGIVLQGQAIFTSLKDDARGGAALPVTGVPLPGDWRGLRLERSSSAALTQLNGMQIFFGGSGVPAFVLRGTQIPLNGLSISRSAGVGLNASAGTTSRLREMVLSDNGIGFEAAAGSAVVLESSFITGNTTLGARNLNPAAPVQASGLWWGHPSGPLDASDDRGSGGLFNPGGLGNPVSDGILYDPVASAVPLFGLGITPVGGALTSQTIVSFLLRAPTAVAVRLSEDPAFAGASFQPLSGSQTFSLSPGDGFKTIFAQFQAATGNTAVVSTQMRLDSSGPSLALTNLAAGAIVTRPLTVVALASDPSGVNRVEFYVDNILLFTDTTNTFSFDWDVRSAVNGPHVFSVVAVDNVGRSTRQDLSVAVATAPPVPPVIVTPTSGTQTSTSSIAVSGTSEPSVIVSLYVNGSLATRLTASAAGTWSVPSVSLVEGANTLSAVASDVTGTSAASALVLVTLDSGPPSPPIFLTVKDLPGGVKRFDWLPPINEPSPTFNLYRSTSVFVMKSQAARVQSGITAEFAIETPPVQGSVFYAVTAQDPSGNESEISNVVQIMVDSTPPTGAIAASPSGVVGPGPVTLTVVASEPIDGDPFVSVTPLGGSPTTVPVTPTGAPLTWSGVFNVLAGMPTGTATVAFSARDLSNNRGTVLTSGSTIVLDTLGPGGAVSVTPVRALGPGTYPMTLTLDEPAAGTPTLRFLPPVGSPLTLALTGSGALWHGDVVIDSSMGDGPGRFDLSAADGFGNVRTGILVGSGFDLDNSQPVAPASFVAAVVPGGSVHMTWGAVSDAVAYVVDRDDGTLVFGAGPHVSLAPVTTLSQDDLPVTDGDFAYAVRAVDAAGNFSAYSNPAGVTSDRTPPGDPSGLTLGIEGKGIRLDWTAPAVNPASSFAVFRSTSPITSLSGLLPAQSGLLTPTALDLPPADGSYSYAVVSRDLAGNQSGFAAAGPFLFDQAAPAITVIGVTDGQFANTPRTITFSATDFSLQSLSATLDGAPFTSGATESNEGDHTLVVSAIDASANTSQKTIAFTIDVTPPSVIVTGVTDGDNLTSAVTPSVTISDLHLGARTITLNGLPFTSGTEIKADGTYTLVAHAADLASNVTDVTVHFVIDAAPPAIASLNIDLPGGGFPTLSWPARPEPDVVGYLVLRDGASLTPIPVTAPAFVDNGFDPFATQVYTVVAVDSASHQGAPRSATLPPVGLSIPSYGTSQTLARRFLDTISASIENRGALPLPAPMSLEMTLKDGATSRGARTLATAVAIGPGASLSLSDVFSTGGGAATTRTLEMALTVVSEPDTRVRVLRTETLAVRESGRDIELFNDPIILGGTARVSLKILNSGSAKMQVRTSQSGGPTPDVEVFLKDLDGNVLASNHLDHRGSGVINTVNLAFAEIGPGGSFLSKPVEVQVPSNAPASVVLEAIVHVTHSDLIGTSDIPGPELRGATPSTTGNPAYLAVAAPDQGVYDQGETVQIAGSAFDTVSSAPVPNTVVRVGISTRGFDRILFATTDPNGNFQTSFNPLPSEAGAYTLWATHPTVTQRASQAVFEILGLTLNPASFNLRMSQNSSFAIPVTFKNTGEMALTGFVFDVQGGTGLTGVVDDSGLPTPLQPGQSGRVVLTVTADINADLANFATLHITTAEGVVRSFDVAIALLPALPTIQTDPSFTEVGLGTGSVIARNVRIRNTGFAPLKNIVLEPPTTPWMTLGVDPNLPEIPVGGSADVPVVFSPPASITPAIYPDRFIIHSSNHVAYTQNLFAIVTSSTTGDAAFEVRNTENVLLPGASVWIQSLQVPTLQFTQTTDAGGVTTFHALPSGPYQFRIQSTGTEPATGKFDVEPDQVTPIGVIMNVVYVSFEWSVTPVIIEDRYDFKLTATFKTSVPAPVLVADPPNFKVELEPGATFVGEYKVTNHGLVAGDNLAITTSTSPGLLFETLVTGVPRIGAMQSITVPFRLTMLAGTSAAPLSATPAGGAAPGGGRVGAQMGGGFDPCQPQAAYSYQATTYTCLAGVVSSSTATVNVAATQPTGAFGICDDGCNPCECIPGFAGNICKCLKSIAFDKQLSCDCLIQSNAADACSCLTGNDPVACIKAIPGPIGEAAGLIDFGVRCAANIVKCACALVPSICSPGGGGPAGGGGGGGGGFGGYGGGYGGISTSGGCGP